MKNSKAGRRKKRIPAYVYSKLHHYIGKVSCQQMVESKRIQSILKKDPLETSLPTSHID